VRHSRRRPGHRLTHYWQNLGPGLITGASDNDPSGIGTYSVAGATTGYRLLWMAVVTYPMLVAVQAMAAQVGAVRHAGLGRVIEEKFGRRVLVVAVVTLVVSNVVTIAADLGGIAAGVNLLVPVPVKLVIPLVGALLIGVEVGWSYPRFAGVLKWSSVVLLLYVVSAFLASPDWSEALRGTVIPRLGLDRDSVSAAIAVLGTTISPYMFFWITSEEVEEDKKMDIPRDARDRRRDVASGMAYANGIFYFIVLASAATLGAHHQTVETAADAARALAPVAGHRAADLFAIGIVGGGLIAVPVLAGSCAYPVAELFGWAEGLGARAREASGFYATIAGAVAIGVVINLVGIDPVKALVYAAILQGLLAPALIVLLTKVAHDPDVMGPDASGPVDTGLGYMAAAVMSIAGVVYIAMLVRG
jgi:NRAMP (natural resistance-associated macrophage protein)-like metal ion transporter